MSPAALRVCSVAVEYLADRGYDRCSLNDIAELAGMRKASLYSHFRNKNDLITAVLTLALVEEQAFLSDCFTADIGELKGGKYLEEVSRRFVSSAHLRFLLRTAYAPPESLHDRVTDLYRSYLEDLRNHFTKALQHSHEPSMTATMVMTEGYLGIVDSVQVELLYGEAGSVETRRYALWKILTNYIQQDTSADSRQV
jgi:AcrR family transcriptional regulator